MWFLELLKFLWPVLVQLLPLILKAVAGDKTAKGRARAIQKEVHREAILMKEGDEDEIARREKVRIVVIEQLFRERAIRLRRKDISK